MKIRTEGSVEGEGPILKIHNFYKISLSDLARVTNEIMSAIIGSNCKLIGYPYGVEASPLLIENIQYRGQCTDRAEQAHGILAELIAHIMLHSA